MPVTLPVSEETTPNQSGISLTSEGPLHLAELLEVRKALLCSFKYCDSLYPILQTKTLIKSAKKALLFWFFGDFRCGALLFMVIHVIYKYKNK